MTNINIIELIATVVSIIGVWLTARQIIWCWPVSLLGLIFQLYIFSSSGLYMQSFLQFFYMGVTFYGWYNWLYGGENKSALKVKRIRAKNAALYLLAGIISAFIIGILFENFTDDPLPWLDSATSVCGIIATLLMAKKIIENWLIWILNDIVVSGMCYYQELYIFAFLYFIFIILAIYGYSEWKKEMKT